MQKHLGPVWAMAMVQIRCQEGHLPRFTLPRPGFFEQCCIVLQRRFAMFMRETWRGNPGQKDSFGEDKLPMVAFQPATIGIMRVGSWRWCRCLRYQKYYGHHQQNQHQHNHNSYNPHCHHPAKSASSYDNQAGKACSEPHPPNLLICITSTASSAGRRRMVDLGLVLLCACGIGAMHRGNMGAHSPDFPGSLALETKGVSWQTGQSDQKDVLSSVLCIAPMFLDLASQSVSRSFQVNQNSVCWQVDSWHREQTRIPRIPRSCNLVLQKMVLHHPTIPMAITWFVDWMIGWSDLYYELTSPYFLVISMPGACEPSWKLLGSNPVKIQHRIWRWNLWKWDVCGGGAVWLWWCLYLACFVLCLYATRQSSYVPDGPWLVICSLFVEGLWRSLDAV